MTVSPSASGVKSGGSPGLRALNEASFSTRNPLSLRRQPVVGQAGRGRPRVGALLPALKHQPRLVGEAAHEEFGAVLLGEPIGQDHNGRDDGGSPAGGAVAAAPPGPTFAHSVRVLLSPTPGVDGSEPVAILQEPHVHVIQLQRQRQPHPADAGQYLQHLTGARGSREREAQRHGGLVVGEGRYPVPRRRPGSAYGT